MLAGLFLEVLGVGEIEFEDAGGCGFKLDVGEEIVCIGVDGAGARRGDNGGA